MSSKFQTGEPVNTPDISTEAPANSGAMSRAAMFGSLALSLPAGVAMIGVPFAEIYQENPQDFVEGMIAFGGSVAVFAAGYAILKSVAQRTSQR